MATGDRGTSLGEPDRQRRSSYWILLVDDDEAVRKAVGGLLQDQGFRVTACADGHTALKIANSRRQTQADDYYGESSLPDCIVSDVRMPEIDGIKLLQKIRSDPRLGSVPVVLLTAKSMTRDRIAGYDCGADAYLTKPFDPEELLAIVDNVIERKILLGGSNVAVEDLKLELAEMTTLLLEQGGSGIGNGWVKRTDVFFSDDEQKVLDRLCEGLTNKEISSAVFLSGRRIEQILTELYRKTGTRNRTELVRWAVSTGNSGV